MLFLPVRTFGDSVCACICAQSCPTLCNLIDCSPPVSFIYGIFQAKILEWVAISFSRKIPLDVGKTAIWMMMMMMIITANIY